MCMYQVVYNNFHKGYPRDDTLLVYNTQWEFPHDCLRNGSFPRTELHNIEIPMTELDNMEIPMTELHDGNSPYSTDHDCDIMH